MTKKELIALLNANFADNDEVFVAYEDKYWGGNCLCDIDSIKDQRFERCSFHYEIMRDGKWGKSEDEKNRNPYAIGFMGDCKQVIDREWSVMKRCLVIKEIDNETLAVRDN